MSTPPHHGHEHTHGHRHGHAREAAIGRAFAVGAAVNLAFVVGEAGFGVFANSLALLADAAHNFGDVLGLLLAWWAQALAAREPTRRRTYGYRRFSILASLINSVVLLVGVGIIAGEAIRRLIAPEPVGEVTVMAVAAAGILVNGGSALLFFGERGHDLNVRAAFTHLAADAAVSLGVVLSGLLVMVTGWMVVDPLVGIGVAAVILLSTWGVLRASLDLALDAVPEAVDREAVEAWLGGLPGVSGVHDLHIWALSTTETALTAHLVRPGAGPDDALLSDAAAGLCERFGIVHATLQVEDGAGCAVAGGCLGGQEQDHLGEAA